MIKSFYLTFENSDEWEHSTDWGVFCSRYYFSDATIKENKVNIAGSNGVIDLSSELTGDVVFNNVQGEIGFIILQDSNFDYNAFKNKYHGKRVKIRPDNDMDFYRIGRLSITKDNNQDVLRKVEMKLDADPFRYAMTEKSQTFDIKTPTIPTPTKTGTNKDGFSHNIYRGSIVFNNPVGSDKMGSFYYTPLNMIALNLRGDNKFAIDIKPNTQYYIHADFYFKYRSAPRSSVETQGEEFWDTERDLFFDLKLEDGTVVKELPKNFSAESTIPVDVFFNSGNNTTLNFICGGYLCRLSYSIPATNGTIKITNIKLVEPDVDNAIIKNEGRKQIVPKISATSSCDAIINQKAMVIVANEEKKNFDLVLDGGANSVTFFGNQGGTATISYREAYL